jgi:hypothetical protein
VYSFRVRHEGEERRRRDDLCKEIEEMAVKETRKEVRDLILDTQSTERYSATIISLERLGGRGNTGEITKVVNSLLGDVPEPRVYEILN